MIANRFFVRLTHRARIRTGPSSHRRPWPIWVLRYGLCFAPRTTDGPFIAWSGLDHVSEGVRDEPVYRFTSPGWRTWHGSRCASKAPLQGYPPRGASYEEVLNGLAICEEVLALEFERL